MIDQMNIADILLVEDNPNDAEFILRAFKNANMHHRVIVVNDGEQALDFIFSSEHLNQFSFMQKLRLIILDLKLPKVDGLEVLKVLKSDPRTSFIPVVVLTSSKEDQDLTETYRLGVNSFVTKPVNFNQFSETVTEIGNYWLQYNQMPQGV